jgi:putative effector of murein hydrolase
MKINMVRALLLRCLTGILGASYGIPLLNALGVKDPICRGLGIGSSAQGLGVASMAGEPDALPFASVAMVLTAVAATTLASIPSFRNALVQTTVGTAVAV